MTCSPTLSTNSKILRCDFCYQPASSGIPGDTILRISVLMCPECLGKIPEDLANKFLDAAKCNDVDSTGKEKV